VRLSLTAADLAGAGRRDRVRAGSRLRILVGPDAGLELETDHDGDGHYEERQTIPTAPVVSGGPQLVSATTIGPETLPGPTRSARTRLSSSTAS
jgi:hypothetical protein